MLKEYDKAKIKVDIMAIKKAMIKKYRCKECGFVFHGINAFSIGIECGQIFVFCPECNNEI